MSDGGRCSKEAVEVMKESSGRPRDRVSQRQHFTIEYSGENPI